MVHGTLEALRVLHTVPTKASPAVHAALMETGDTDIERQLFSYWQLEAALSAALLSSGGAGTVSALGERLQVQHTVATQRLYRGVLTSPELQFALTASTSAVRGDDGAGIMKLASYVKELVALRSGSDSSAGAAAGAGVPVSAISAEALTAIQMRQQQHDTDIELLTAEVCVVCGARERRTRSARNRPRGVHFFV